MFTFLYMYNTFQNKMYKQTKQNIVFILMKCKNIYLVQQFLQKL